MKKRKLIGVIVAASLVVGINATLAKQDQQTGQDSQIDQSSPDRATQSDQERQTSESEQSTQIQPASPPSLNEPSGASTATWNKEKFLQDVAQSGVAEVNMAQLGTTKAQDPGLKEVARRLVTDHSKLNDQIKELATKQGTTLATEIDSKHQRMIDHLSGLSGSEFDKAFASHMVQGHKKSIAKFKQAAAQTEDTEIRDFAKATLPTLQEHLTQIQKYAPEGVAGVAVEDPAGAETEAEAESKPDYKSPEDQNQTEPSPETESPDPSLDADSSIKSDTP